jgi:hypothetical protein
MLEMAFHALELQNFLGGTCPLTPAGGPWLHHLLFLPPENSALATPLQICSNSTQGFAFTK